MTKLPTMLQRLDYPAAFTQTRIAFALKIASIFAATVIMFYQDLVSIFSSALQDKTTLYLLGVPLIVIYLVYRKRKMLRTVISTNSGYQPKNELYLTTLSGLLLAVTVIVLYWHGSYTLTPLGYHLFALPLFASALVLILFNAQTLRQLVFPVAFLFFLVPPPLARTGVLILVLMGTLLLILISGKAFKTHILNRKHVKCNECTTKSQSDRSICKECGRIFHPSTAKLHRIDVAKMAAIIIICLLIAFQTTAHAQQLVTTITPTGQQYSSQILPESNQYSLTYLSEAFPEETHLHLDLCLNYKYEPLANESIIEVQVGLIMTSDLSSLPAYYPGKGQMLKDQRKISLSGASYFVYQSSYISTNIQAVLCWNTSAVFMINQTAQQKYAEIALSARPSEMTELPAVKQQLIALANLIMNYWQPSEHWSEVTLIISQNATRLGIATSVLLAGTIVYYTAEARRQKKINMVAVSKLNKRDMDIVKALQTAKPATVGNLEVTLQKNTGKTMTLEELEQRLRELEKVGIIRSQISNENDIPIQTWKA